MPEYQFWEIQIAVESVLYFGLIMYFPFKNIKNILNALVKAECILVWIY